MPQVYDHYTSDKHVYTVMEYIEGENFQELLKKGTKFTIKDIIRWGTQLSEALVYLHKQTPPIIHRDIKPSNIMLTPQGNVCLIDFNISTEQDKSKTVIAYTDGYSPLEQYGLLKSDARNHTHNSSVGEDATELLLNQEGRMEEDSDKTELINVTDINGIAEEDKGGMLEEHGHSKVSSIHSKDNTGNSTRKDGMARVDERSDIYSLGATLYHIVTGKRPEKATEDVTPLSECEVKANDGLIYIIEKAMKQMPSQRFQTAAQVHKAFVNIKMLDHEYRSYARYRDLCIGGAILLACISIVCMILGFRRMQTEEYNTYIAYLEEVKELYFRGEMDEASTICQNAIDLRPGDLEAYIEMVNINYMWQKYEEGLAIVDSIVTEETAIDGDSDDRMALLFFLAGECYMGMEEFESAADSYRKAISYQSEEGSYYTRCAIALARSGNMKDAESFLESAIQKGISDAAIHLTKAEILLGENKFKEAEELVYKVLDMTEESNITYHAYLTGVQIYEEGADVIENSVELKRQLLERAVNSLDDSYTISLSEQLANVYYEMAGVETEESKVVEYYENALKYFDSIYSSGYKNSHVLQNIANINQTLGNYEEAETALLDMINLYPEDYSGYMYLALLYSEIQDRITVENRDYSVVFENYEKANTLYQLHLNNGGNVDMNIEMLGNRIEDIRLLTN